ncbi:unnamed protein product [Symbiodinium microadriaticum]|nr:unnamed protein product [Symbiodinium microadriaticum]CAE7914627.1 unnamed protein product [Symbiodinium sp. KB8]
MGPKPSATCKPEANIPNLDWNDSMFCLPWAQLDQVDLYRGGKSEILPSLYRKGHQGPEVSRPLGDFADFQNQIARSRRGPGLLRSGGKPPLPFERLEFAENVRPRPRPCKRTTREEGAATGSMRPIEPG